MSKKLTKKTPNTTPEPENPPVENSESNIDAVETPIADAESDTEPDDETAVESTEPETTPDESAESNTDAPLETADTDKPKRKTKKKSVVAQNQCPKCQHVSSNKAIKLGGVNRAQCFIEIEGTAFHSVESQRIMCERCKQIHFVKTYQ